MCTREEVCGDVFFSFSSSGGLQASALGKSACIAQKRLILDADLSGLKVQQVQVIILIPEDAEDITEHEWLQAAAHNDAFDFLKDEEELYTLSDGKPFNGQG